jgi:7-keto-8-aminopelargonate synthetase-like enzyme
MPPASVAGVLKALEIMQREPQRIEKLWKIVNKMKAAYENMGYKTGATESPIIPLHIGEDLVTFRMTKELGEEGVFATPIVSPAVPPGMALIRTSYSATHTEAQLDFVLEKFKKIGQKMGVIPSGVHA